MDDNRRLYDSRARSYADEWYPNELMLPAIREFLGTTGLARPRVLDLGCGPGNESMRLAREGAEVVGVDFAPECVKVARERNPAIAFHELDYFDITTALGKFDGIFACSSLIHLEDPELGAVLDILKAVLAPGGLVLDIFMVGDEPRVTYPRIGEEQVERVCVRRPPARQNALYAERGYEFVRDVRLDPSIGEDWHASLYRSIGRPA